MARQYEQADHPFRDDGVDLPSPPAEDVRDTTPEYAPTGYEQNQAPRGWLVFSLGIIGLASFGGLLAYSFFFSFIPLHPITLLSLSMSMPAFFLGLADLKAMRAGAMDRRQRGLTITGTLLGGAASLLALGVTASWAGWLYFFFE